MKILVLLAAAALIASCSTTPPTRADYRPVPDRVLFDEANRVTGIRSADLQWNDSATNRGYVGRVVVAEGLSREAAARAVSTVYSIVRQGRPAESITLAVRQGDDELKDLPGTPLTGSREELEDIYGPQPGDGRPPS